MFVVENILFYNMTCYMYNFLKNIKFQRYEKC